MNDDAPFIVTLAFDPALQDRLERERRLYFPEHLNVVPAHVSLFHHLPGHAAQEVTDTIAAACAATRAFPVEVTGLMGLGRGTGYRLMADSTLHRRLAAAFHGMLTRQDRQPWRPHVTLQNKVDPQQARDLQQRLSAGFAPFGGRAEAVRLWRYVGGPWEPAGVFPLSA